MKIVVLMMWVVNVACTKVAYRPSPEVTWHNAHLLYKGKLFDGLLIEKFEHVGTQRETVYRKGLAHGAEREYTIRDRKLVALRNYRQGRRHRVHEGWFLDGKRRFHYEYNDQGENHGEFWEWHQSGHPSLFARFENGRALGRKVWRPDGKIYMNWVFDEEGRGVGVPGSKLCFQLREEGIAALMK